ncbi:ubiquitin carboxyl-terminal hydrolase 20-like protein [Sarcoptes scabiei]|uniref:ubiquitinyl hydrolase 1 n=1 Tax=Sarcoptes scabiei TaxID=52283 RepID=A0A132AFG7_SARSC|nr:ubiquitin carboxyl-terminal hydrolase 20-like protein [Sarcoptes scabiei]
MGDDEAFWIRNTKGLKGLRNLGNTCYINAALQALANIKPLRVYFMETYLRKLRLQSDSSIDELFSHLITSMWSSNKSSSSNQSHKQSNSQRNEDDDDDDVIDNDGVARHRNQSFDSNVILCAFVSYIWKRYPLFHPGDQHDSHEFLQCLLSELHDSLKIPYDPLLRSKQVELKNFDPNLKRIAEELMESDNDDAEEYESKINEFIRISNSNLEGKKSIKLSKSEEHNSNQANRSEISSSFTMPILHRPDQLCCPVGIENHNFNDLDHQEESKPKLKFKSIISDIFGGVLENTIRCSNCNKNSTLYETFFNLSIPIAAIDRAIQNKIQNSLIHPLRIGSSSNSASFPTTLSSRSLFQIDSSNATIVGKTINFALETFQYYYSNFWSWLDWFFSLMKTPSIDLIDCLEAFFNPELLENENRYYCENCKKLCNGIKTIRVKRSPEILVMHLNRYQSSNSFIRKITSQLNFPLCDLSLKSFQVSSSSSRSRNSTIHNDDDLYDLIAIICHNGTQVTNGHYVCYALNGKSMEWFEFDDITVSHISKDQILSMASSAYMLFYQLNEQKSQSQKALEIIYDMEKLWIQKMRDCTFLERLFSNQNNFFYFSFNSYKPALDSASINIKSFVLNKHWINSFLSTYNPGPIDNNEMICLHQSIRPSEFLFFNSTTLPVIEPVGQFLWLLYGGGPILNNKNPILVCTECSSSMEFLDYQRKNEFEYFFHCQSQQQMFRKLKLKSTDLLITLKSEENVNAIQSFLEKKIEQKSLIIEEIDTSAPSELDQNPHETTEDDAMVERSLNDNTCPSYYLISSEWMCKWLCFVNLRYDQSIVPARDRQLYLLLEQFLKCSKQSDQDGNDGYVRKITLQCDLIHPPICSIIRTLTATYAKNQTQLGSAEQMLDQIDLDLHTIRPPDRIDNWSLFGMRQRIIIENQRRQQLKRPSIFFSDNIDGCDGNDETVLQQNFALLREYLENINEKIPINSDGGDDDDDSNDVDVFNGPGDVDSNEEKNQFQYKFSFRSQKNLNEESSCVFYLISAEFWHLFHDIYQGGPIIMFDSMLNKFIVQVTHSDLHWFYLKHLSSIDDIEDRSDSCANIDLTRDDENSTIEKEQEQNEINLIQEEKSDDFEVETPLTTMIEHQSASSFSSLLRKRKNRRKLKSKKVPPTSDDNVFDVNEKVFDSIHQEEIVVEDEKNE